LKTLAGLTIIFSALGAVLILFALDFIFRWLDQQPDTQLLDKQLNNEEVKSKGTSEQKEQKPKLAA